MKTLKISVLDNEGKISEGKALPAEIFGVEASPVLVGQAVKRFLSNQRKAQAKVKTRTQVHGSGAKIWKQKGTGRARHGDRQAPIFVGGGVSHGPTGGQNYHQKLNQKMVQKAILKILTDKLTDKKLFLIDEIEAKKTKEVFSFIQKIKGNLGIKEKISFLTAGNDELIRCLRNIKDVFVLGVNSLDPYTLLKSEYLFMTKEALEELEKNNKKEKKELHASKS